MSFRSEQHRRNVAQLPCAKCRIEGHSQCAHPNQAKYGKSLAMKADDIFCFPMCADRPGVFGCHTKHDRLIGITKEEAEAFEDRAIARTLADLVYAGKLRVVK